MDATRKVVADVRARRDLVGVTQKAFQPAHVSMWLASASAGDQDRPA